MRGEVTQFDLHVVAVDEVAAIESSSGCCWRCRRVPEPPSLPLETNMASWSPVAPLPVGRLNLCLAAAPNSLIVAGGYDFPPPDYMASAISYNASSDAWSDALPMSTNRDSFGCATAGNHVYAIAGESGDYPFTLASVERLDLDDTSRGWVVLDAGLSQARQGHGVAALGGVVYAAGGIDAYAKVLASVEAINGTDVLTMPSMLEPRYYFGFAAFGGRLFAAGGCGPGVGPVNVLSSVEAFDGRAWTSLPPLPAPRARMAAAATASALFLLGGCPARRNATSDPCDSLLASVLRFDDARNSWTQAPSLPRPNAWLSAAALGDSVYAVGGGLSYGRNETYRLDY